MSGVCQNGSDILKIVSDGHITYVYFAAKMNYFKIVLTVNVEKIIAVLTP